MSWHFSRALVGEYLGVNSSDGELFAGWSSILSAPKYSCKGKTKGTLIRSQYGTMFVPLTDTLGKALLTWFQEGFLANHSAQQHTESKLQLTSGPKCSESSEKLNQNLSLLRTSLPKLLSKPTAIVKGLATGLVQLPYLRKTWVQTIRKRYWLLAHADVCRKLRCAINAETPQLSSLRPGVWESGPGESRVADGMAHRLDRIKAIGNGQVPIMAATAWSILVRQLGL